VESNPELMLADARSTSQGLWRIAHLAQDVADSLDARIENEQLDGQAEAAELREVLEQVQILSLEMSEQLDAYQRRHAAR
jgi:hypothetical protein